MPALLRPDCLAGLLAALLAVSAAVPATTWAESPDDETSLPRRQYEDGRARKDVFRPLAAAARQSTVRILCDGEPACLGIIVQPDGYILTKHSMLHGKITCRLQGGRTLPVANDYRVAAAYDLAMVRIDADDLPVADWSDRGRIHYGRLVAAPGMKDDELRVGAISVLEREIRPRTARLDFAFGPPEGFGEEFTRGVKVTEVTPGSGAAEAGLQAGDLIVTLDGTEVEVPADFAYRYWSYWGGEEVSLTVLRDGRRLQLMLSTQRVPFAPNRQRGFAAAIQHDAAILPGNVGGPLIDLDGKIIAVNIARPSRSETFAIPGSIVRVLLPALLGR